MVRELSKDNSKKIHVRGDKEASYGQVIESIVLLQKSGLDSVELVTDDAKNKSVISIASKCISIIKKFYVVVI